MFEIMIPMRAPKNRLHQGRILPSSSHEIPDQSSIHFIHFQVHPPRKFSHMFDARNTHFV